MPDTTTISLSEGAERLGITTRQLLDLVDAGDLEPVKVDGVLRLDPETIAAYLAKSTG